jgi:excisionase family DNA binding protein
MPHEAFLTTEEVIQYLQLNLKTVYRLIRSGQLPAVRVGRQWRFRKADIDSLQNRKTVPTTSGTHRLLVVDDDAAAREVISTTLRAMAGYEVDVAADGPTALAMIRAQDFAAVLIDLRMPAMDGVTLLEKLRAIAPTLPVVILTAASTEADAIAAANLGVSGYLLKPYEWPRIVEAVERALGTRNDPPRR